MSQSRDQVKREIVRQELKLLVDQYKKVSERLLGNLDPINEPVLKREKERLDKEITEKEAELGELVAQLGEDRGGRAETTTTNIGRSSVSELRRSIVIPPETPFPYLLDRSEQEEKLIEALVAHHHGSPQRPFVCIIHGDELECHTLYLKRLKIRSLPEILSAWYPQEAKKTPVAEFEAQLPLSKLGDLDFEQALWSGLRAATHGSRPVPQQEIVKSVSANKLAVIIKSTLLTEDVKRISLNPIEAILKFWDKWPEITENPLIFVAISFKYQRNRGKNWRVIKNWSRSRLNKLIRRYLDEVDFSRYENLYGVLLPELSAIRRSDAEALIHHEEVSKYELGDRDIRSLYDEPALCTPDGCIPMETFLDRLSEIIDRRGFRHG
jgi:hypothetical protein